MAKSLVVHGKGAIKRMMVNDCKQRPIRNAANIDGAERKGSLKPG